MKMRPLRTIASILLLLLFLCFQVQENLADVGTARSYDPPYLPTKCNGYNEDQFPEGGYFAAASDGLWDNGAACGRKYRMRCISGPNRACKGGSIVVQVVDFCRDNPCLATLMLSNKAFDAISRISTAKINIEFIQI
ncbi:EG45-like domain containing protein [Jatropha curcas]|uniref:EG45-like domain containing protein n=1 Tax=Jatropha curcas TaxID=180498 RepID=UPI0009D74DF1|nr:EG45-like domain containing protein [Jatropha curcas]